MTPQHAPGRTRRKPWLRVAVAAAGVPLLILAGCGNPGAGTSARADDNGATDSSSESSAPAEGADAAFGVDTVSWPGDLAGAKALFDRMPPTLAGAKLRRSGASEVPVVGVMYGDPNHGSSAWVMEAGSEVRDATSALAVMFGMTMACEKDSYRGTAPQSQYGSVPDADRSGTYTPDGDPWWFACTIDGAEGNPNFTGYALGWASGDLGWLTTTPDRNTSRALAKALLAAR